VIKPEVKNVKQNGNSLEILLSFPAEAEYFQGHFPNTPILPGVAQVHWAVRFAEEYFGIIPRLEQMKAIKFSKIIFPNKDVILTLTRGEQQNKFSYTYTQGPEHFSSGSLTFQP
jgi:3-hydroxymyristoyl/3-hydroxydecanoyl-(acyl carrier protein) dehydratase